MRGWDRTCLDAEDLEAAPPDDGGHAPHALQGRVCEGGEGVLRPDAGRQMGATSGKYSRYVIKSMGDEAASR